VCNIPSSYPARPEGAHQVDSTQLTDAGDGRAVATVTSRVAANVDGRGLAEGKILLCSVVCRCASFIMANARVPQCSEGHSEM
jgi:hypothetical protein